MATDIPALRYRCPRLKAEFVLSPCEKNRRWVHALLGAFKNPHLGPLEHCRVCQGQDLEEILEGKIMAMEEDLRTTGETPAPPEASPGKYPEFPPPAAVKGLIKGQFCKNHPDREAHKNKHGQYMGFCRECLAERAAKNRRGNLSWRELGETSGPEQEPPPGAPCKNHPDRPAVVDKLGRTMGYCRECIRERGQRNGRLSQQTGATAPPVSIPLNQEKYAGLREWLANMAEENERTLQAEVMYRLKLAMREGRGVG